MKAPSLKPFLPKGLYGRSALILLFPVVAIQLVVSIVFIQRHFEGVTILMASNVALEINHLLERIDTAPDMDEANRQIRQLAGPLGFAVTLDTVENPPLPDRMGLLDLTGNNVISTFRARIPATLSIDLKSDNSKVDLFLFSNKGQVTVRFGRYRVSASNPHQLLVLMIATAILMTVISFLFLRNQVRPIKRLAAAAEAFGKGKNEDFYVSGATEVRSAGQAFIDMRARIERQIEQRTLMLSGVSHDMRTPLTRLKLGLSMIGPDEEVADMVKDVDDMELMLDEFLAFTRGDSTESLELVNPVELAQTLFSDAKRGQSDVSLDISVAAQECSKIEIRPVAVSRAVENLLTNAARYGTKTRLLLDIIGNRLCFIVEDDGPGIAEEDREKATRPFIRLDQSRNQNHGTGVGLGLSIAMDIASSHGGHLTLTQSEDFGGLKASFCIPR